MKNHKKEYIFLMILLLPALYIGYLISGLFLVPDLDFGNVTFYMEQIMKQPFRPYWNDKSPACILAAGVVWLFGFTQYYANASRNLMHGQEYGTDKWMNIKSFNTIFEDKKDPSNNIILSRHARKSYDCYKTGLNNNGFVVGGAGTGKTAYTMTPNLLQFHGSNVYTDPKGNLYEEMGNILLKAGNIVQCINLCEMEKSAKYNPFVLIRKASDISKLITNLIANTTPVEMNPTGDPFWEKAEKLYLQSIFSYVWLECPRWEIDENGEEIFLDRTFRTVLKLMDEAAVSDEGMKSALDLRMERLAATHSMGEKHPAVARYNRCVRGAADTIRSIIISANSRFDPFDDPELLRILDGNDIDLTAMAVGKNGDGKTRTSLFIVIPDDDDTFNFVPGMLYTQMFQEWYYQARLMGGKLPLDVGCWFDEFANIKMPAAFDKILATCRSRGIYCWIFLQSLAQIKKLFKDGAWEGLVGNCDIFLYLGGNEQSTQKYVSEILGKWTIDKRSEGETMGRNGSSNKNYDVLGRELLTPTEVRKLSNRKCICFVRGQDPILDEKMKIWRDKKYLAARALGKCTTQSPAHTEIEMLGEDSLSYYRMLQKKGENVEFYEMELEDFLAYDFSEDGEKGTLSNEEIRAAFANPDFKEKIKKDEERATEQKMEDAIRALQRPLLELIADDLLTEGQREEIILCLKAGLPEDMIKKIIHPANSREKMANLREIAILINSSEKV